MIEKEQKIIPVITIDGPTSSGKGTMGRLLADKLSWNFLDSGILYRVLAFVALRNGVGADDIQALRHLASNLKVRISAKVGQAPRVFLKEKDEDISEAIRQESYGIFASQIAVLSEIRNALLGCLQSFRKSPGLIADGRDMGTVVFPDATLKIFLTAHPKKRAFRRWQQLQNKNINVSLHEVETDLLARDIRDEQRSVAPLKPALDAKIIDTTDLNVDQVLEFLLKQVESLVKETKDN